jgi:hypothetical protein
MDEVDPEVPYDERYSLRLAEYSQDDSHNTHLMGRTRPSSSPLGYVVTISALNSIHRRAEVFAPGRWTVTGPLISMSGGAVTSCFSTVYALSGGNIA